MSDTGQEMDVNGGLQTRSDQPEGLTATTFASFGRLWSHSCLAHPLTLGGRERPIGTGGRVRPRG
jgi:hypothetical protein